MLKINAQKPVFNVNANTFPALLSAAAAIGRINSQTATVGVNATLRSYPSASDIARSIGTVRVPIDAYLRTTPRLNGIVGLPP